MPGRTLALTVVATLLASACLGTRPAPSSEPVPAPEWIACEHPYPCGDEWPVDLEGPFDVREVQRIEIPSFDGTKLRGWVILPTTPPDLRLPTVLLLSPYPGHTGATPEDPDIFFSNVYDGPFRALSQAGYAIAVVNIRGSGASEGCNSFWGPDEQRDAPIVVEWLAAQPWSNGRIGMSGVSYPATDALLAAVSGTPGLKAVIVAGIHADPYLRAATPQGLMITEYTALDSVLFEALVGAPPPVLAAPGGPDYVLTSGTTAKATRTCEGFDSRDEVIGQFTGDRAAFWDPRRVSDQFDDITAAVMIAQGFLDLPYTEDYLWPLLEGRPRSFYQGPWGHEFPNAYPTVGLDAWTERVLTWFDFWLKGIGPEPAFVDAVEYFDEADGFHASSAWPPADAREEVLYLRGSELTPGAGPGNTFFQSVPGPATARLALCEGMTAPDARRAVTLLSEPFAEGAIIAGNPFLYLTATASAAAGQFVASLFLVPGDFACPQGATSSDARLLTSGGVDLRHHTGTMHAVPFPVNVPTPIRVDFHSLANVTRAGERLALVLYFGDPNDRTASPSTPTFTFRAGDEAASHLVLPLMQGSLGGAAPSLAYPPRPFSTFD